MPDKFTLAKEETALLIIDIQERLAPAVHDAQKVIRNAGILLSVAAKMEIPVIATEQYPRGLGKTVAELGGLLEGARVFEKISFSACTDEVTAALRRSGRRKIIVAGMETHVCVFQTVRDLLDLGYQVFVPGDAAGSRAEANHRNGLSLMSAMGAVITNTETAIFDLLKQAGTPLFKEMSKLIK